MEETEEDVTEIPEQYDEPEIDYPTKKRKKPILTPSKRQEIQIMGKYLLRDMPLFKFEIVIYMLAGMGAFMAYILDRVEIFPGLLQKAIIPVILIPIAIWFIKWFFYMPNKKRVPSMRIYRSGVVELGVEDISKGYLVYGSGDNIERKYITKINKHTEASTGKPFVITSELKGENLNLIGDEKTDMQGKETTALLEMNTAVVTKNVMNRMLKSMQPTIQNPLFMLLLINLFMVAFLVVKTMGFLPE